MSRWTRWLLAGSGLVLLAGILMFAIPRQAHVQIDLAYIHQHCAPVSEVALDDVAAHMTVDGGIEGTIYIFENEPPDGPPVVIEAAWRDFLTEPFCLAGVGCLFAPRLGPACMTP